MIDARKSGAGRRVGFVCAAAICGLVLLTGVASAKWNVFRAGNVILKFDGGVSPKQLPRHELASVGVIGKFEIATTDGSHAPAFRAGTFDSDRNLAIDATGLPVCRKGQLEANTSQTAKRLCGESIVGTGSGTVEIAFPEQGPILVKSPFLFFNGGVRSGITTLFVHIYVTVPAPVAVITTVKFKRIHKGRYGLRFVSDVPEIAGGAGSVIDAHFRLERTFTYKGEKRSYLRAKCPDGQFLFRVVSTEFDVEGLPPGTSPSVSGTIARPCSPRD
jgi:hypothetical protein